MKPKIALLLLALALPLCAQPVDQCRAQSMMAQDLSDQLTARSQERAQMRAVLDEANTKLQAALKEIESLKKGPEPSHK